MTKGEFVLEGILKGFIADFKFSEDLEKDMFDLLNKHDRSITAEHSLRVARKAKELAKRFGVDEKSTEIAGLLHDISCIIPRNRMLDVARELDIEVLAEEEQVPMILHQKLSKAIAKEVFNIEDDEILNAMGCHTTLRKDATSLDMVLFIADKMEWDQKDIPPYMDEIKEGLNISLEHGAYTYIKYLLDDRENLMVVHPWLLEAHEDLLEKVK